MNRNYTDECCVIIVTYNGEPWLERCLKSIDEGTVRPKVYLIDNCSVDRSVEIASRFQNVEVLANNENLGFGKANNLGIRKAFSLGCKYFFLLNQDTHVESDAVENLMQSSHQNKDYGIISPIHKDGGLIHLDDLFYRYVKKERQQTFLIDYEAGQFRRDLYEVPFVNAAAWMVSRKCFEDAGVFHPLFYHYGEDNNLAQRIMKQGYKIGVLSNATIYHHREKRGDNPFKKDLKVMLKWKMMINVFQYLETGSPIKHRILILIDIFKMAFSAENPNSISFFKFAIKNWRRVHKEVKSFDKNQLKVDVS